MQELSRADLVNSAKKVLFCDGVIDSNYRGEIFIIAANIGTKQITIRQYEKIAQMLIGSYFRHLKIESVASP